MHSPWRVVSKTCTYAHHSMNAQTLVVLSWVVVEECGERLKSSWEREITLHILQVRSEPASGCRGAKEGIVPVSSHRKAGSDPESPMMAMCLCPGTTVRRTP